MTSERHIVGPSLAQGLIEDVAGGQLLDQATRRYIGDVLSWDIATARVERLQRGDASPLFGMLRDAELFSCDENGNEIERGRIGNGCRGTKGVGRAPSQDPEVVHVNPMAQARYQALRGDALRTTNAVINDGQGISIVVRRFGIHDVRLTLPVRVAMELVTGDKALKWQSKLFRGDSTPVLKDAEEKGIEALTLGAKAWWEAI